MYSMLKISENGFPDTITVGQKKYTRALQSNRFSGLNPKAVYSDGVAFYILKIEKNRKIEDFFPKNKAAVTNKKNKQAFFDTPIPPSPLHKAQVSHLESLRDYATAMSVIASRIARTLCPSMMVPENILCRLQDGRPAVLSKFLSNPLHEFLSEKPVIQQKKKQLTSQGRELRPTDWSETPLPASTLDLTREESYLLGRIYYTGLLMGHWDIINNIDLSNSGSTMDKGQRKACIVDWGNCLGVGFGGQNQDATAFKNPEFLGLSLDEAKPITGFTGCVPFDRIVYPRLPRQLIQGLFNLDIHNTSPAHQKMLQGFFDAHRESYALRQEIDAIVSEAIQDTLSTNKDFEKNLPSELLYTGKGSYSFVGNALVRDSRRGKPELTSILKGRLDSLDHIVSQLRQGKSMDDIADKLFGEITHSQSSPPSRMG